MNCSHTGCNLDAIGEAYFPGIDKWYPYCETHYENLARGGMKVRRLGESQP